jgi:chaperone modulatory protein CbpM
MKQPDHPNTQPQADQSEVLTLEEVCRACAVQSEFLMELLDEGVIEPIEGKAPESWRFTTIQLHHVSVAWRLQRDLGVNPAGTAVVLQLLDEVQTLRAQLGQTAPWAERH